MLSQWWAECSKCKLQDLANASLQVLCEGCFSFLVVSLSCIMSLDVSRPPSLRARTISLIYQYQSWSLAHMLINILNWNQVSMWQERQLSLFIIHKFYFHLFFYLKILSRPFNNQHLWCFYGHLQTWDKQCQGRHPVTRHTSRWRSAKACSAFSFQLS